MRLIDADALKLYIDKEVEEDKVLDGWAFFFKVYLDDAPTIDDDRPKGEWIDMGGYEVCKNCREVKRFPHWKFCPNCGAQMKGASNEIEMS